MGWPTAKRRLVFSALIIACGLAVCGWQVEEHLRFRRNAAQALINRGRDITLTLGVLVRSGRRAGVVSKERLQSALQDLIRTGELESIAILPVSGEPLASAGTPIELEPDMLQARGEYWHEHTLTIMNVMDLGSMIGEDGTRTRPPILVLPNRRPPEIRPPVEGGPNVPGGENPGGQPPNDRRPAFAFGRPSWMSQTDYDAVIQKSGVHSLVITLSTDQMHRAVSADLLLRSLVSLLALGGAVASTLAWRNVARNSELQIRLVKAGEMNAHLKEMNLAAAGLAHETRNPLNLIRGLAQMITIEAKDSPKLKQHASTIIEEADRVTVQLNEFIDFSKPREAHFAPVEVSRLVADVARTLMPDMEDKQVHLQPPPTPLTISADEQLLRQALFNLLLNAVQAVPNGGHIEVRWVVTGPGEVALEIADDGPGVPEAERANIFKPYVTMRPKGAGLGLAIVQQIVSVHRWEIVCVANEPQGALFRVSHLRVTPARDET